MSHIDALEDASEALADVHDMDVPWRRYAEAAVEAYLTGRGLTQAQFELLLSAYSTGLRAAADIVEEQPESKEGRYGGNMRIAELGTCREIKLKLHKMIEKASTI
jgi:hypothetical protein